MRAFREDRWVVSLEDIGIPDIPSLGRYEYHVVRPGLTYHSHVEAVEISYLVRGRQIYCVGGKEYTLAGGDLFVTAPGEPHDTGGHPEDCGAMYWLIARMPQKGGSLLALPPAESEVIADKFTNLPERQFSGRPVMQQIFRRLFEIYDEPPSQLKRVILMNQLLLCIFEVLDCFDHHRRRNCSQEIRRIVEMVQTYPEEEFSLEDLAEEARLSVSRFKARFKGEMGIGPHEFILRNKVEAAKRALLQDRESVTNVAMRFGFSSSQYFATVFRRFTYQTPAEFRTASGFCNVPLRDGTIW